MKNIKEAFVRKGAYIAVLAALGVMAGCGGGGGGGGVAAPGLSGKFVDGYISGATVTLDVNNDRICAATEPKTTTDAAGNFTFPAGSGSHMTCASGGTDLSTGLPFVGVAKAPAGATMITPLTNLVMAQLDAALGAPVAGQASAPSPAQLSTAQTAIQNNLGLGAFNILTADPVAPGNQTLLSTTAAVQTMLIQVAQAVGLAAQNGGAALTPAQQDAIFAAAAASAAAQIALAPVASTLVLANNTIAATVTAATTLPELVGTAAAIPPATAANIATNLQTVVGQQIADSVSQVLSATSVASLDAAATAGQAPLSPTSPLTLTITPNLATLANAVFVPATLTNVIPGAGVLVNGVAAAAVTPGAIKSVVTAPGAGMLTLQLDFLAALPTPVIAANQALAIEVVSTNPLDARRFQAVIDQANIAISAGGVVSVTIPLTAQMFIYAKHTNGTAANVTIANAVTVACPTGQISCFVTNIAAAGAITGGSIQLNVAGILTALAGQPGMAGINFALGNFDVNMVVSGVTSFSNNAGTQLQPTMGVAVSSAVAGAAPVASVIGQGNTINVTVQ